MATLYDIKADILRLYEMAEDEDEQVFIDTLEAVKGELEEKAEGYGTILRHLKKDAEFYKEEADRLIERAKRIEKRHETIEKTLMNTLIDLDMKKLTTEHFDFTVKTNPPKVNLLFPEKEIINDIDAKFITEKVTKSISKTAIKEAIEAGEEVSFAEIVQDKKLKY